MTPLHLSPRGCGFHKKEKSESVATMYPLILHPPCPRFFFSHTPPLSAPSLAKPLLLPIFSKAFEAAGVLSGLPGSSSKRTRNGGGRTCVSAKGASFQAPEKNRLLILNAADTLSLSRRSLLLCTLDQERIGSTERNTESHRPKRAKQSVSASCVGVGSDVSAVSIFAYKGR